ncbi:DUF2209 domain-containing protein [Methanocella sp. CWC-04]|uniref:DUF2209 domain-containing protein n=1 Tax=Methanooceanicella nereidis TaxID=2052831 RepID=A0AAP2W5Y1_9EURY|nr:DUF2209 family protein [Methanocella sp. CWC-04]MCD1293759.1 DUF2209 domain-containing protein [Methanocella sp. CWC-04]
MRAVAVDISGRHKLPDGRYCLVCVAVSAVLSPFNVQKIDDMKMIKSISDEVSIDVISELVLRSSAKFGGVIVTEPGEFYNLPEWRVEAILGRKFKYAESIGERKAIEIAHHASLAAHRMIQEL